MYPADVILEPVVEGMIRLGESLHEGVSAGPVVNGDDPVVAVRRRRQKGSMLGEALALTMRGATLREGRLLFADEQADGGGMSARLAG